MPSDIGVQIGIDGEKQFSDALKAMNAELKNLDSQMKLAETGMEGLTDAEGNVIDKSTAMRNVSEALDKKLDLLHTQYDRQKAKLNELAEALEKAKREEGETSEAAGKAQNAYNKQYTELQKLETQINQTATAQAKLTQSQEDAAESHSKLDAAAEKLGFTQQNLGDIVGDLAGKLGVQLPQGATEAIGSLGELGVAAGAAAGAAAAAIAAIVEAEKKLIDITREAAASADELLTLSAQTGLSTKELQEFAYASELIDVDLSTLQGSLTKLTNNMQTAQKAVQKARTEGKELTNEAALAFQRLRVQVTDGSGQLRNAKDVFDEVIDALGEIENSTERDALAMDIFGRSAQDLNPLILAGSEALRDLAREANDTGYVLDDLALSKLGAVDDAFQRLEKSRETLTNRIAVKFAPSLTEAAAQAQNAIERIGDSLERSGAVESFGSILKSASDLIEPLTQLAEFVIPVLSKAMEYLALNLAVIADEVKFLANFNLIGLGKAAVTGDWETLGKNLSFQSTQEAFSKITEKTRTAGREAARKEIDQMYGSLDSSDYAAQLKSQTDKIIEQTATNSYLTGVSFASQLSEDNYLEGLNLGSEVATNSYADGLSTGAQLAMQSYAKGLDSVQQSLNNAQYSYVSNGSSPSLSQLAGQSGGRNAWGVPDGTTASEWLEANRGQTLGPITGVHRWDEHNYLSERGSYKNPTFEEVAQYNKEYFNADPEDRPIIVQTFLDGHVVAESTTKYQDQEARARG